MRTKDGSRDDRKTGKTAMKKSRWWKPMRWISSKHAAENANALHGQVMLTKILTLAIGLLYASDYTRVESLHQQHVG